MVAPKNPANVVNERRNQVWLLMLKGRNSQAIKKELNLAFLTKKSKQYVYGMAYK